MTAWGPQRLCLAPGAIGGASFGGIVALEMAALLPARSVRYELPETYLRAGSGAADGSARPATPKTATTAALDHPPSGWPQSPRR